MTSDPLAPKIMPGGDAVCGYCDSGDSRQCPYHFNGAGGSAGMFQFIQSTWGKHDMSHPEGPT